MRVRCLAQYLEGSVEQANDLWNLLFISDSAVYLRGVPRKGWQDRIRSLVGIGLETGDEEHQTRIALAEIVAVEVSKPQNLWQRLVTPYPKERITIRAQDRWFTVAPDMPVDEIASALAPSGRREHD